MNHIAVVIPVLNEELIIDELIQRVSKSVIQISESFQIIIVDDGSTDKTWTKIVNCAQIYPKIHGIRFSRNFGHHYAISAGLKYVEADWVIVMDGDLQDRPEIIPILYQEAVKGFDIVFVSRINRTESIYYKVLQRLFYVALRILSGIKFDSKQANFSIISRKVVNAFNNFPEYSRFYGSTVNWLGFKKSFIFADHGKRLLGKPSYTLRKRFKLAADIILSFSDRPLHFAIYLGIFSSGVALMYMIWILIGVKFHGFSVQGWPSLMAVSLFLGGAILIILGIIGSYLSRIFLEVKSRPLYLVSDEIVSSKKN